MRVPLALVGSTLSAALVLASDIHLRTADDERAQLLLDVLRRLAPSVECLVLNGDIFDFCFGGSAYFRNKFAVLGAALQEVARRGTRVVFVEGNHEFHLDRLGWPDIEIVRERDVVVTLKSGERIKVTHGDLIKDDILYRIFRGLVKSRFAAFCARWIPGALLDGYALGHAKVSRAQDRYRRLDHGAILAAADCWLADATYDHGVIGHFHVPYAEKRRGGIGLVVGVDCWDVPNLLVYQDGGFARIFLAGPGEPFTPSPLESIFLAE